MIRFHRMSILQTSAVNLAVFGNCHPTLATFNHAGSRTRGAQRMIKLIGGDGAKITDQGGGDGLSTNVDMSTAPRGQRVDINLYLFYIYLSLSSLSLFFSCPR